MGYRPWGHKEVDRTEWLHFDFLSSVAQRTCEPPSDVVWYRPGDDLARKERGFLFLKPAVSDRQGPVYSAGNSIHYPVINYNHK